jgi:hypothetical protein
MHVTGNDRSDDRSTGDGRAPAEAGAGSDRQARTAVEAALAREYRFQARLSQALVTDVPEQGIAEVLHEHLGLGVTLEDPYGRVLAQAGAHGREPFPRLTRAQRDRLIEAARRMSGRGISWRVWPPPTAPCSA